MKYFFTKTLLASLCILAPAISMAATQGTEVDNTEMNSRDASNTTLTSEDQAMGTKSDVELTRKIRAELSSNSNLSTYAQNVKIITINGRVTLRGPVRSTDERASIENTANRFAGANMVSNQLEVKPVQ